MQYIRKKEKESVLLYVPEERLQEREREELYAERQMECVLQQR